jgi:peptidoglycan/LPS O-acetylase OafA/YrhL
VRIQQLDGLRGLAALVVCLCHLLEILFFHGERPIGLINWGQIVWDGNLAVYIFFISSGVALTWPLLEKRPHWQNLPTLLTKRYIRLTLPILASCILAGLIMHFGWMYHLELAPKISLENWLGTMPILELNLQVIWFSLVGVYTDYSDGATYNSVLWTMRAEMIGSILVFTGLCLLIHPLFIFGIFTLLISVFPHEPAMAILLGSLVAIGWRKIQHQKWVRYLWWLTIIALALSYLPHQSRGNLAAAGLAIGIVVGSLAAGIPQRLLIQPLCLWLGKISFSLYLIHMLVIQSFTSLLILQFGTSQVVSLWIGILTLAVCFALAILFHRFIDEPSIYLSRKI